MPVTFTQGDLFTSNLVLAHGVNCQGFMGSGIAPEFKKRYPMMYDVYRGICLDNKLVPGDVFPWYEKGEVKVLNLATQQVIGRHAKFEYIEAAFDKILEKQKNWKLTSFAMPKIGCGIGGLNWRDIKNLVITKFESSDISVTVYE